MTDPEKKQKRPLTDDEWRKLELESARRAGYREGALTVIGIVLFVLAVWWGLATSPKL